MSLFVNTNVLSLQATRHLFNSSTALDVSFQRLSSGFRINSAADDAAGLQISDRMTTDILGNGQVVRNLNDGISYAQIAEGGLIETTQMLQRMRQLAVQAQNGIMSDADRLAINEEVQQLKLETDRIANTTEAFGRLPLLGENINNIAPVNSIGDLLTNGVQADNIKSGIKPFGYIPAGSTDISLTLESYLQDDDLQIFTTSGRHVTGTALGNHSWNIQGVSTETDMKNQVLTPKNGFTNNAAYNPAGLNTSGTNTYNDMTFSYSGDNDSNNNGTTWDVGDSDFETLHIDKVNENLILIVNGEGIFNLTATWDKIGDGKGILQTGLAGDVRITASNSADTDLEFITIEETPATSAALGISRVDLSTAENAEKSLDLLDKAIEKVGAYRADYGADINQMKSTLRNIQTQQENVSAARSQIRDTDYAAETAELTQQQIVQQASISILAQANTQPQLALSLLG